MYKSYDYGSESLDTLSSIPSSIDSVWVLREDFESPVTTQKKTKPTNSCLKKNVNKDKKNKFNNDANKTTKCVHYAPFLSKDICSYSNNINKKEEYTKRDSSEPKNPVPILRQTHSQDPTTKKKNSKELKWQLNNNNNNKAPIGTSKEHICSRHQYQYQHHIQSDLLFSSTDTSADELDVTESSLSSLSSHSISTLNSTFTESNSPPSPSLSLISSNTNDSFQATHTSQPTKNVRFVSEDYETIQTTSSDEETSSELNYSDLNHFQLNPTVLQAQLKFQQSQQDKMRKIKLKSSKTKSIIAEPSSEKKSKSKKVDFSDFKFGKSKSNSNKTKANACDDIKGLANTTNFDSSNKTMYTDPMTILNVVATSGSSQCFSSTQSSPKSSELSHTPTCQEDSSFSSNLSTSSSSGDNIAASAKTTSSSSSSSSSNSASLSSTSSGISSNISSASSTTSETAFTVISDSVVPKLMANRATLNSSGAPAFSVANGGRRVAPKAVIQDDGDIRVVKSDNNNNNSINNVIARKQAPNDGSKFYRDLNQRASMRLPSETASMLQRHASERLSHRVMPSHFQYPYGSNVNQHGYQYQPQANNNNNNNNCQSAYQNYQPFSQQHHQSQLAAAAAAAAAMDKEKQREALIEYMKMQQQKIRPSVNAADSTKPNMNNNNINKNSQCLSNVLPRKQMSVNNNIECQMNINKVAQPITDNSNSSPTLRTQMRSTSNNARLINNRKSTPVISSLNNNNNNTSNVLDCNNMYMNNSNNIPIQHHVNKTSAKRENAMGICYLMFGPETKRTLLPSQVTGIDTVKALFVRAFPDKLTMNFLDDERTIKIYIKDQQKDLFYELDEMSDVKDRCVLKLVDLNAAAASSPAVATNPQPQSVAEQPKQDYYQLTQSNFIDAEPNATAKINDFYSSPIVRHHLHQTGSYRYTPILPSADQYVASANTRAVKPQKPSQPPPVVTQLQHSSSRSSSEPRHNVNPYVANSSQMPETYDNIAEKQRINHQQQIYYQQQQQHQSRISNSNFYGTTQRYPQIPQRDIKSVDRDQVLIYSQSPSNRMNNNNNNNNNNNSQRCISDNNNKSAKMCTTTTNQNPIKMGVNAKLNSQTKMSQISKDYDNAALHALTLEDLVDQRSLRSDSLTPRREILIDEDLTDDDVTEVSYGNVASCVKKAPVESLDDTLIEDYESSKVKMRLMQEQLETLTNLVHKALANKDLNQLAAQINGHLSFDKQSEKQQGQHMSTSVLASRKVQPKTQHGLNLSDINGRTKSLRQELMTVRKLHETLNLNFSDSMKSFIGQLNEKLSSFCRNEVNEKIKLDLIIYKYQLDSGKIETELSDLENVVDDLRQNILRRKSSVSIDDVECYALALSQLSKQLVGLKQSFSSIREHLKANGSQKSKLAENKFLNEETASLDLIIRRCKRITGILIILKKLAIAPRQSQLMTHSLNRALTKKKNQLQQQQQQQFPVNDQSEYQTTNSMRKLFEDIEGIKPDHEQRLLAIEVDRAFSQLMNEISSVANEINTSLSRKSESLSRGSSVSPVRAPGDRRSYDVDSQKLASQHCHSQMPNNYYHSLGTTATRIPSYARHSAAAGRLVANYAGNKKGSVNNVLLNKIELVVNPSNDEAGGDSCNDETESLTTSKHHHQHKQQQAHLTNQNCLFINEVSHQAEASGTESVKEGASQAELTIEKRTKFRAQKQALKESKEQELANNTNSSSSNSISSSSSILENTSFPSNSSLNSSNGGNSPPSSFTSSPSRTPTPSSPLSQANSPTTTSDANNKVNTAQQLCNSLNSQLQTFAIQSKTIDRAFHLETVQEEDSVSISTDNTTKDNNNNDKKCQGNNNNNINQLYDQLSHLKPIPRSNIPIKSSKPVEPTVVLTSSMNLASEFTDADTGKKVSKSMIPVNKVRFSQNFEDSNAVHITEASTRTISNSSSSSSCASNSSGYNSDNNGNNCNANRPNLRHSSGLKKSTEFFSNNQAAQNTMVVQRRLMAGGQQAGGESPNTQKRVSLSVTDL